MDSENKDDFDKFVEELQEEIDEKDRRDFSEYALELGKNPYKFGEFSDDEDNVVKNLYRGPCGDAILVSLKIKDGKIADIRYKSFGCTTSSIAGSQMVKLAENKSIEEAVKISQDDILNALVRFPEDSHHCALLAADSLKKAIEKYQNYQK